MAQLASLAEIKDYYQALTSEGLHWNLCSDELLEQKLQQPQIKKIDDVNWSILHPFDGTEGIEACTR